MWAQLSGMAVCLANLPTCKAPVVVFSDANIDEAGRSTVFGAIAHSGQVCMSAERVIVHKGVVSEFLGEVKRVGEIGGVVL
ncbi:hypothetical protein AB1N83_004490 [Pleurotus pulmonarius]